MLFQNPTKILKNINVTKKYLDLLVYAAGTNIPKMLLSHRFEGFEKNEIHVSS